MFERLAEEESKTKAVVVAGEQPADTEMEDEQKDDPAGGQPQVGAEHSLPQPCSSGCLPPLLPTLLHPVSFGKTEESGRGAGGGDPW